MTRASYFRNDNTAVRVLTVPFWSARHESAAFEVEDPGIVVSHCGLRAALIVRPCLLAYSMWYSSR